MDKTNMIFNNIINIVLSMRISDALDILIFAYVSYKLYGLIKETRAQQLLKGILVLLVGLKASEFFQLHVVNWILRNTMTVGLIALLIVFQPELRRILEYIGRTRLLKKSDFLDENLVFNMIDEVVGAAESLSRQKIGALIVFERETGLNEIIQTGTLLNSYVSRALLINIFIPNTPLHDGAVIIRDETIMAAGCFLPLTENAYLSKELGTRHRAAIGITEKSDALSLIVSEETGSISIAIRGEITRNLSTEQLTRILKENLGTDDESSVLLKKRWRHK